MIFKSKRKMILRKSKFPIYDDQLLECHIKSDVYLISRDRTLKYLFYSLTGFFSSSIIDSLSNRIVILNIYKPVIIFSMFGTLFSSIYMYIYLRKYSNMYTKWNILKYRDINPGAMELYRSEDIKVYTDIKLDVERYYGENLD